MFEKEHCCILYSLVAINPKKKLRREAAGSTRQDLKVGISRSVYCGILINKVLDVCF